MTLRWTVWGVVAGLSVTAACVDTGITVGGNDRDAGRGGSTGSADGGGGTAGSGGSAGTGGGTGGASGSGGMAGTGGRDGGAIDPNAFWQNDPPPRWCGADGGTLVPGGTPECPDDKNRQGCACPTVGAQAPCWPGLRANRNLGACRDGTTTCTQTGEFGSVWGACMGYVVPTPGATGAAACNCFSQGQWFLANVSPCFIRQTAGGPVTGSVSTYIDDAGVARCPNPITTPLMPQPGKTFTSNTLRVDCAGQFRLCYELKAGNGSAPSPSDCSLAKVCTEGAYPDAGATQAFPDLPSWVATNPACAAAFANDGGYGEMTVQGLSVRCDEVNDGDGGPKVFNRVTYCPLSCNSNPTGPGCANCMQGGSGSF